MRSKFSYGLFIVLAYGLIQFLILLHMDYTFMDHEEMYSGTIAREILHGNSLPLFQMQYASFTGGSLVTGLLAAPAFWLFGESYFSLKLVPLLLSLVNIAIWYLFLYEFYSPMAAIIACVLFILSPPGYSYTCLYATGDSWEAGLLTIAILYLLFKVMTQERATPSIRNFSLYLLAYLCGFGLYLSLKFVLGFILLALLWVWGIAAKRKIVLHKSSLGCVLFFILGLMPWLYYNISTGVSSLSAICSRLHSSPGPIDLFEQFRQYIIHHIPGSLLLDGVANWNVGCYSWLYFGGYCFAYGVLLWTAIRKSYYHAVRQEHDAAAPIANTWVIRTMLIYPIAFIAFFSTFGDPVEWLADRHLFGSYRYAAGQFIPFMIATIAIFLSDVLPRGGKLTRAMAGLLLLLIIPHLIISKLNFILRPSAGDIISMPGYNYHILGWKMAEWYPPRDAVQRIQGGFDDQVRGELLVGFFDRLMRTIYWPSQEELKATSEDTLRRNLHEAQRTILLRVQGMPEEYRAVLYSRFADYECVLKGQKKYSILNPYLPETWNENHQPHDLLKRPPPVAS